MAWILTPALVSLRNAFNARYPNRSKNSDGSKGDLAHQKTKSGHNPDESGNPEYTDADNIDEVRAIDVDKDLNSPTDTMQDVINRILATPADLARLRYIIYNRMIWSRNNGWRSAAYNGDNDHTEHCHFSGDPATDDDDSPWTSVLGQQTGVTDMYILATCAETGPAVWGGDGSFFRPIVSMTHAKSLESAGAVWRNYGTRQDMLQTIGPVALSDVGRAVAPTADEIAEAIIHKAGELWRSLG